MFLDIGHAALGERKTFAGHKLHVGCADRADIVHIDKIRAVRENEFPVLQQFIADRSKQIRAGDLLATVRIIDDFAVLCLDKNNLGQADLVHTDLTV